MSIARIISYGILGGCFTIISVGILLIIINKIGEFITEHNCSYSKIWELMGRVNELEDKMNKKEKKK